MKLVQWLKGMSLIVGIQSMLTGCNVEVKRPEIPNSEETVTITLPPDSQQVEGQVAEEQISLSELRMELNSLLEVGETSTIKVLAKNSKGENVDISSSAELSIDSGASKISLDKGNLTFKCEVEGKSKLSARELKWNLNINVDVECEAKTRKANLSPVFDATATTPGLAYSGNFTNFLDLSSPEIYGYASWGTESKDAYRAVMEFKIPEDIDLAKIHSAQLSFRRTSASGGPDVSAFALFGYQGNGTPEIADANRTQNQVAPDSKMWDLDQNLEVTSFVKGLANSTQVFAGFVIRGKEGQGGLHSSESFSPEYRPLLKIKVLAK